MQPGRRGRAESQYARSAPRLAGAIRERREAQALSQETLAARASCSVSWLSKLERGQIVEPGFFPVLAVLRALGLADDLAQTLDHGE